MFDPTRRMLLMIAVLMLAAPAALALEMIEDHTDLGGPFADGPAVTAACLECHEDVAHDFMKTSHWNWAPVQKVGNKEVALGKKNLINNFCIAVESNWPRCTSCHAGYGWKDASFDFSEAGNIDCLVCHDQTGTYRKFPTGAGHPVYKPQEWEGKIWEPVDLAGVARGVGKPSRKNCGACHFFGGGGNNVKHGDLEKALTDPERSLDVHMSGDGAGFSCQECHVTESHDILGNAMFDSPSGTNHLDCTQCHEDRIHAKRILDWHAKSIGCQTCHIPEFARANPTKMWWDWSTAGQDLPEDKDEYGMDAYVKKKGSFKWEKNVRPVYAWYNGVSGQYQMGDQMNPSEVTHLNWPQGNRVDPVAKIMPFKLMRGKQAYDSVNNTLVVPKLFGKDGYWKTFDWKSAIELGQQAVGQPFSGEYGFAETVAYWRINHMVAPKEAALRCTECHAKEGQTRLDWIALGYEGDPSHKRGVSRYELSDEYRDLD